MAVCAVTGGSLTVASGCARKLSSACVTVSNGADSPLLPPSCASTGTPPKTRSALQFCPRMIDTRLGRAPKDCRQGGIHRGQVRRPRATGQGLDPVEFEGNRRRRWATAGKPTFSGRGV